MFKNIAAVLFDLDGTLVDSAPDLSAAANKMRTDRKMVSLPSEDYRFMAGAGARGMLYVAFNMTPEHPDFEAMKAEFFRNYETDLTQQTFAFRGIPELIEALNKARIKWGVVTNKSARFTIPLTKAMPLFGTALTIVSGDSTPHAKPHPAPLLEAVRQLNLMPEQCIYVGDDERDIVAGRGAGMPTVAAAYGYLGASGNTVAWKADAVINNPEELLQLLGLP